MGGRKGGQPKGSFGFDGGMEGRFFVPRQCRSLTKKLDRWCMQWPNGGGGKPQDTPLQATHNIVDVINLHLRRSLEAI